MHRITASAGNWQPDAVGFIEQDPAPIVILTAADTDILAIASALDQLPADFPAVRVVNLLHLQHPASIDHYGETVLSQAKVAIVRLLGGLNYWFYGMEVLSQAGAAVVALPGDDQPDWTLMEQSTLPLSLVDQLWQHALAGGSQNWGALLQRVANSVLHTDYPTAPVRPLPDIGLYQPPCPALPATAPSVGILLYRAHVVAGNTAAVDTLAETLATLGIRSHCIYTYTLQDPALPSFLRQHWQQQIGLILNTTGFAMTKLAATPADTDLKLDLWQQLDVPILQVICSGDTREQWQKRGLSPRDLAMHVVLPEVDGRIITRAVSFKAVAAYDERLQVPVVRYMPDRERVRWVAELAANWLKLRQTPVAAQKLALVLANYPNRDGRLANGVGLDTPASCVNILSALVAAGYNLGNAVPADSEALMQRLTLGQTNDPEGNAWRPVAQSLTAAAYQHFWQSLPEAVQTAVIAQWGEPPPTDYVIAGLQLGQVFIGIQPPRGYDLDPSLNYHAADLVPPHSYLAFYVWLRQCFGVQAIVHVGKHGNLEWLPGLSVALSENCFPEVALGPLPHFYPFIVNDPGEGAQAKRRAQAVILDHLTPPLTRAELYGPLLELERLLDEYNDAAMLDPRRLSLLQRQIEALVQQESLLNGLSATDPLGALDGYLCDLKEAQIRNGLHRLGELPTGMAWVDLVVALARYPGSHPGLTQAIAIDLALPFDPLIADSALAYANLPALLQPWLSIPCQRQGDVVTALETLAQHWVGQLLAHESFEPPPGPASQTCLNWIRDTLLPRLAQTPNEIGNLLHGLRGGYIPSGPAGAPTRGRPDVLPTGRNFFAVDIRAIPTETAWQVGQKAAEAVIERYLQDEGEYPRSLGLSVWGTATMRTGGDDWAEAMALIGVRPVWQGQSRRVIDFEVLPLEVLGRPRVDVTLRISGFFRDAFPNLINLFDAAVQAIAALPEPAALNPLRDKVLQDTAHWQAQGLSPEQAQIQASYRVFGCKPGAYGAGLQGLIEAQNWQTDADLARAYLNWSSTAYTGNARPHHAPAAFAQRLQSLNIVLHNQDNREHDLLDSDDYYQFQGGMIAAVRSLTGHNPQAYFGDHARPERPQIKALRQEIDKVYRSRVINPKWIEAIQQHGYKGSFEMAATLDYLFAYAATSQQVGEFMWSGVAQAYILDAPVQAFHQRHNPWALRDMCDRLLEAQQRDYWHDPKLQAQLEQVQLEAEATIEQASDPDHA